MPSRASAPRSHLGCKECKRRHVKCDETLPCCRRCARHNRKCSLSEIFESAHFVPASNWLYDSTLANPGGLQTARRTPTRILRPLASASELPFQSKNEHRRVSTGGPNSTLPPALCFQDAHGSLSATWDSCRAATSPPLGENALSLSPDEQSLLEFYITDTANTLNEQPAISCLFRTVAPALALTRPYLLHCLLAIAGQHRLSSITSSEDSTAKTRLQHHVLDYQNRFLSVFKEEINDRTMVDDCVAACLGGILIMMSSLASYQTAADGSAKALDKMTEILRLKAGVGHIFLSRLNEIETSDIGAMLAMNAPPSPDIVLDESRAISLESLELLCTVERLSELDRQTYTAALRGLQNTYRATARNIEDVGHRLGWVIADNAGRLADLVSARAPEALLLAAHWAVTLEPWPHAWWMKNLGRDIVLEVKQTLPLSYRHFLQWPLEHFEQP